jgi:hypothetical protein
LKGESPHPCVKHTQAQRTFQQKVAKNIKNGKSELATSENCFCKGPPYEVSRMSAGHSFWGGGHPISYHCGTPLGVPKLDFPKVDSSIAEGNGEAEDVI